MAFATGLIYCVVIKQDSYRAVQTTVKSVSVKDELALMVGGQLPFAPFVERFAELHLVSRGVGYPYLQRIVVLDQLAVKLVSVGRHYLDAQRYSVEEYLTCVLSWRSY